MTSFLATPTTGIFDTAERVHNNRNLGQREAEARATHRSNILEGHSVRDSRAVTDAHNRALTANQQFALSTAQTNAARDDEYRRLLKAQYDVGLTPFPDIDDYDNPRDGFTTTPPPTQMQGTPVLSNAGVPAPTPDGGVATQPAPTPNSPYTTQVPTQQAGLPPNPNEVLNVSSTGNEPPAPQGVYRGPNVGYVNPPPPTTGQAPWKAALDAQNAQPQQGGGLSTAGAPPAQPTLQPQQIGQNEQVTKGITKREQAREFHMGVIRQQEQRVRDAMQLASLSSNPEQAAANVALLQQQLLATQRGAQLEMDVLDTNIYALQGKHAMDAFRTGDVRMVEAILGQQYGGAPVQVIQQGADRYAIKVGENIVSIEDARSLDVKVRTQTSAAFEQAHAENLFEVAKLEQERILAAIPGWKPVIHTDTISGKTFLISATGIGEFNVREIRETQDVNDNPQTSVSPSLYSTGTGRGGASVTDYTSKLTN
ncbi:MAG: hypothetical protein K0U66_06215 [Gammaproteobacteria bacterium]|nr:hypothetical protein [Gammaproteobacteria bacterium]